MTSPEHDTMADRKLSRLQKGLLCWLLSETERIESGGSGYERLTLLGWGVLWYPSKGGDEWSATDRAVTSRCLRRLEKRGLIIRTNHISGHGVQYIGGFTAPKRTTSIMLTPKGKETAKRLTKEQE